MLIFIQSHLLPDVGEELGTAEFLIGCFLSCYVRLFVPFFGSQLHFDDVLLLLSYNKGSAKNINLVHAH